jgi:feruloyl esterase
VLRGTEENAMKRERHRDAIVWLLLAGAGVSWGAGCGKAGRNPGAVGDGTAGSAAAGGADDSAAGHPGAGASSGAAGTSGNTAGGSDGGASAAAGAAAVADAGAAAEAGAGAGGGPAVLPECDEGLKSLELGAATDITLVRAFSAGSLLSLKTPAAAGTPAALMDLCLVKLNIGPGNPGPATAPSTSRGIGVEIWLPSRARWNGRYQALGNGGFAGGPDVSSLDAIGAYRPGLAAFFEAGEKGFVTSINDGGHAGVDASFALLPDGKLNQVLLADFAERATHRVAEATKALIEHFYGRPAEYSYFNGCSEGGREGLMEAQRHPDDFDGILVGAPALYFDRLNMSALWPQIVTRVELGAPMADAKLVAATAAANAACSKALTGQPDGYITDPGACRYDPTTDAALLCVAAGGTNTQASCLSLAEAKVVRKIWYGPTADAAAPAPDPATDNGRAPLGALQNGQLWYGIERGTRLAGHPVWGGLAALLAPPLGPETAALALQNPALAPPTFMNATGNGANQWQTLGYAGYLEAFEAARDRLGPLLATDDPDLSAFAARGGRLLIWHGTGDSLISPHGTLRYYEAVAQQAGGYAEAQQYARFYLGPGFDHCFLASVAGTNPPAPGQDGDPGLGLFPKLIDWVEQGRAPDQLAARSGPDDSPLRARPWCLYPKRLKYVSGDVNTGNFACE